MKVYRKSFESKAIATILFLFFGGIVSFVFWNFIADSSSIYSYLLFALLFFIPCLIWLGEIRWRLITTDHSMINKGLFSEQEVDFSDVKGFSTKDSVITIELKGNNTEAFSIRNSIEGPDDFEDWVRSDFTDLGETTVMDEKAKIFQNEAFGATVDERKRRLDHAQITSYVLHIIALALLLFLLIWPDPYYIAWALCITYPIAPYWAYRKYNGLIRIVPDRDNPYPSLGFALLASAFAMTLAVFGYQFIDSQPLWTLGCIIAIGMTYLFLQKTMKRYQNERMLLIFSCAYLFAAGWFYGYGLCTYINCEFDRKTAQVYKATILDKYRVHGSKTTTNYLCLSNWGPSKISTTISVTLSLYNSFNKSDIAIIDYHQGNLGIPWYKISTDKGNN